MAVAGPAAGGGPADLVTLFATISQGISSGFTKDLGETIGETLKSVVQGRKRKMSEEDISELAEDPVLVDVHGHHLHDDAVKVGD